MVSSTLEAPRSEVVPATEQVKTETVLAGGWKYGDAKGVMVGPNGEQISWTEHRHDGKHEGEFATCSRESCTKFRQRTSKAAEPKAAKAPRQSKAARVVEPREDGGSTKAEIMADLAKVLPNAVPNAEEAAKFSSRPARKAS